MELTILRQSMVCVKGLDSSAPETLWQRFVPIARFRIAELVGNNALVIQYVSHGKRAIRIQVDRMAIQIRPYDGHITATKSHRVKM
jgi:hypothetical protein